MSIENGFGGTTHFDNSNGLNRSNESERPLARLGFGTSHLAGRLGPKESLRILDVAFDAGIRHFDTAPMYGYGGAEGVLGEFLRDKRDQVTLATKFGIEPPKRSPLMGMAKAAAKVVISLAPSLRGKVAKRAGSMVSTGNFTVAQAGMSLDRSLAALRTSHIDLFLMHDVVAEQIGPDLLAFLEEAKARGRIGRYGATFVKGEMDKVAKSRGSFGDVIQVADDAVSSARGLLPPDGLCVTHSVLRARFKPFAAALEGDKALAMRCSDALGFDCSDRRRLGRLFLLAALERNRGGAVLFSSTDERSIRENAGVGARGEFRSSQVDLLDQLVSAGAVANHGDIS